MSSHIDKSQPPSSAAYVHRHPYSSFTSWSDVENYASVNTSTKNDKSTAFLHRLVPPLSSKSHKGSSGRVGILGGNERYTGAPYYAAMSALSVGADLAFVFCAEEASLPIKCYSPELMVASVYHAKEFREALKQKQDAKAKMEVEEGTKGETMELLEEAEKHCESLVADMVEEVTSLFDRMHVLIVGPGLGRCPLVMQATYGIIKCAMDAKVPLVLDADALFLLSQEPYRHLLTSSANSNDKNGVGAVMVMTPNVVEYKRLVEASEKASNESADATGEEEQRDMVVVKKGKHDVIFRPPQNALDMEPDNDKNSYDIMVCKERGGLKRSGGIGDVLAGTIGTFVAWNRILQQNQSTGEDDVIGGDDVLVRACWTACCVVKRSTSMAFEKKKRSMTASDVLHELGGVVNEISSQYVLDEEK